MPNPNAANPSEMPPDMSQAMQEAQRYLHEAQRLQAAGDRAGADRAGYKAMEIIQQFNATRRAPAAAKPAPAKDKPAGSESGSMLDAVKSALGL